MAQFDVYRNMDKDTNKAYPYFVDIQNDLLETLNSRVVIPMTLSDQSDNNYPAHLCPVVKINNKNFALLTHQITSVSVNFLSGKALSLEKSRDQIIGAIDFLVTGI